MTAKSLRSNTAGFTLIEQLFVVTIIGIIASMVIPSLLQSKAAANEAVAISYMRSWCSAQELYHMRHGFYADADNQLFDEGLVDGRGAADSHGYTFSIDNGQGSLYNWWGTARPDLPGQTGNRWFFIDQAGGIRWSTSGQADSNSTPL
jgi:prepilin-type N-terminal cleavage/methylation domain-containing protein